MSMPGVSFPALLFVHACQSAHVKWEKKQQHRKRFVLYRTRYFRKFKTMPYVRDSGENHIKELTRERVRLSKHTTNSVTLGANFLFICNLDNRLSSKDVTHFFNYFIGNDNCVARIKRNRYTGTNVHNGTYSFARLFGRMLLQHISTVCVLLRVPSSLFSFALFLHISPSCCVFICSPSCCLFICSP
ncbi:RNA-binding protein, putative [Plasmodium ovale]|uniref:RNA-binding protein, putative n=1 Tax=Plasmodium ovale TaxID=36330 RepID=A0A1C3KWV4_PLAOA|nr:RNA-binding protein, putative [Plasmodium ovale]